jgi:hypothetical protein
VCGHEQPGEGANARTNWKADAFFSALHHALLSGSVFDSSRRAPTVTTTVSTVGLAKGASELGAPAVGGGEEVGREEVGGEEVGEGAEMAEVDGSEAPGTNSKIKK